MQILIDQILRDGNIGSEHELLDDLMAHRVDFVVCSFNSPIFIQIDFCFWKKKLQSAALDPPLPQKHCELVHSPEQIKNIRRKLISPFGRVIDVIIHLFIGESPAALHRGIDDHGRHWNPLAGEFHFCGQRHADSIRLQTCQTIRNQLGQHRNHAIRQIHTIAPLERLVIKIGIRANKV